MNNQIHPHSGFKPLPLVEPRADAVQSDIKNAPDRAQGPLAPNEKAKKDKETEEKRSAIAEGLRTLRAVIEDADRQSNKRDANLTSLGEALSQVKQPEVQAQLAQLEELMSDLPQEEAESTRSSLKCLADNLHQLESTLASKIDKVEAFTSAHCSTLADVEIYEHNVNRFAQLSDSKPADKEEVSQNLKNLEMTRSNLEPGLKKVKRCVAELPDLDWPGQEYNQLQDKVNALNDLCKEREQLVMCKLGDLEAGQQESCAVEQETVLMQDMCEKSMQDAVQVKSVTSTLCVPAEVYSILNDPIPFADVPWSEQVQAVDDLVNAKQEADSPDNEVDSLNALADKLEALKADKSISEQQQNMQNLTSKQQDSAAADDWAKQTHKEAEPVLGKQIGQLTKPIKGELSKDLLASKEKEKKETEEKGSAIADRLRALRAVIEEADRQFNSPAANLISLSEALSQVKQPEVQAQLVQLEELMSEAESTRSSLNSIAAFLSRLESALAHKIDKVDAFTSAHDSTLVLVDNYALCVAEFVELIVPLSAEELIFHGLFDGLETTRSNLEPELENVKKCAAELPDLKWIDNKWLALQEKCRIITSDQRDQIRFFKRIMGFNQLTARGCLGTQQDSAADEQTHKEAEIVLGKQIRRIKEKAALLHRFNAFESDIRQALNRRKVKLAAGSTAVGKSGEKKDNYVDEYKNLYKGVVKSLSVLERQASEMQSLADQLQPLAQVKPRADAVQSDIKNAPDRAQGPLAPNEKAKKDKETEEKRSAIAEGLRTLRAVIEDADRQSNKRDANLTSLGEALSQVKQPEVQAQLAQLEELMSDLPQEEAESTRSSLKCLADNLHQLESTLASKIDKVEAFTSAHCSTLADVEIYEHNVNRFAQLSDSKPADKEEVSQNLKNLEMTRSNLEPGLKKVKRWVAELPDLDWPGQEYNQLQDKVNALNDLCKEREQLVMCKLGDLEAWQQVSCAVEQETVLMQDKLKAITAGDSDLNDEHLMQRRLELIQRYLAELDRQVNVSEVRLRSLVESGVAKPEWLERQRQQWSAARQRASELQTSWLESLQAMNTVNVTLQKLKDDIEKAKQEADSPDNDVDSLNALADKLEALKADKSISQQLQNMSGMMPFKRRIRQYLVRKHDTLRKMGGDISRKRESLLFFDAIESDTRQALDGLNDKLVTGSTAADKSGKNKKGKKKKDSPEVSVTDNDTLQLYKDVVHSLSALEPHASKMQSLADQLHPLAQVKPRADAVKSDIKDALDRAQKQLVLQQVCDVQQGLRGIVQTEESESTRASLKSVADKLLHLASTLADNFGVESPSFSENLDDRVEFPSGNSNEIEHRIIKQMNLRHPLFIKIVEFPGGTRKIKFKRLTKEKPNSIMCTIKAARNILEQFRILLTQPNITACRVPLLDRVYYVERCCFTVKIWETIMGRRKDTVEFEMLTIQDVIVSLDELLARYGAETLPPAVRLPDAHKSIVLETDENCFGTLVKISETIFGELKNEVSIPETVWEQFLEKFSSQCEDVHTMRWHRKVLKMDASRIDQPQTAPISSPALAQLKVLPEQPKLEVGGRVTGFVSLVNEGVLWMQPEGWPLPQFEADCQLVHMLQSRVGQYCTAEYCGAYYRATIIDINEGKYRVDFVDYGNVEKVDEVFELPDSMYALHAAAIAIVLDAVHCSYNSWSEKQKEVVNKFVNKRVTVVVTKFEEGTYFGEICNELGDSINQMWKDSEEVEIDWGVGTDEKEEVVGQEDPVGWG